MNDQFSPITPPPELVDRWRSDWEALPRWNEVCQFEYVAARSADHELEACCTDIHLVHGGTVANWLRAMRRPKPPSLKEQALETLKYPKDLWSESEVGTIRRAIEALPE